MTKHASKNFRILQIITALLLLILLIAPVRDGICGELSGSLQALSNQSADQKIRVMVFFEEEEQVEAFKAQAANQLTRSQMHQALYGRLKDQSVRKLNDFSSEIANSDLNVLIIKNYWITEAALIEIEASQLNRLADVEGVRFIAPDTTLALIEPTRVMPAPSLSQGVEDNLVVVGADKLWDRGLTGQGRIVGSFDTGVEGSHPALANTWKGLGGDASSAWFDPYGSTFPSDNNGHGTHVMGIMVGRNGADTIGVAFNASWISASVIDRGSGLSKTISDILEAFEWAADPDGNPNTIDDVPDVINHSWGIPQGIFPACDNTFWSAIDNLEALGIVCIFAAGNEGPDSSSLRLPADRPSTALNAFAVGAIDQNTTGYPVAAFSSRGPSSCDESVVKPEVVAPGVNVRSSYKGGGYRLINGTSMAAPHVSAAVALLREYNPEATTLQIKQALYISAIDLGPQGDDNAYGRGIIDLEAALEMIPPPSSAHIEITNYEYNDDGNHVIEPGEQFEFSIELVTQYADVNGLWARLHTPESYASVITDSVSFGSVAADTYADNFADPFVIVLNENVIPASNMPIDIDFYDPDGESLGTERLNIIVAQSQNARYHTLANNSVKMTVDNFGGIGHGPASPSPASGVGGFIPFNNSFDILPEFSLMVAGNQSGHVSDASRSETGFISDNDFMASRETESVIFEPGIFGSTDLHCYYNDSLASDPLGLTVDQRTSLFNTVELENSVIIEYSISAQGYSVDDSLYVGFLMDWDMDAEGVGIEKAGYNYEGKFGYYYNQAEDLYVGVMFLNSDILSHKILPNSLGSKSLLSDSDKFSHLSSGVIGDSVDKWGDYYSIISTRSHRPAEGDSIKIAVAVVVGRDLDDLSQGFVSAFDYYNIATDVEDDFTDNEPLPRDFSLNQNYPNPFNMSTSISFNLSSPGYVRLEVFNILGQKVSTAADGQFSAGLTTIVWDGKSSDGADLASGTYFYRLTVDGKQIDSKKLMILK